MTHDIFEATNGVQLTREQIVYYGWHEGGVEQTTDGFLVDGIKYKPVNPDSDKS